MSKLDIIRAWKDASYRQSLSPSQREQIPANPAGLTELDDDALTTITGGFERRSSDGLAIQPRSEGAHTFTVSHDICCTSVYRRECGGEYVWG